MADNEKKEGQPFAATGGPAPGNAGTEQTIAGLNPGRQNGPMPSMRVVGQYLKDLSFENPNAPHSLTPSEEQPRIDISVNVNARTLGTSDYEVELHLDAKAIKDDKTVFAAELLYAGIFRLENIPQEALHPVVLIECPRMLFPFARQIMADATRNGGFPPLMLDPIDFAGMYQQRLAAQQEQGGDQPDTQA